MSENLAKPKHEAFCREYVVDFNGAQAAIRAGYSERTARAIASELLTKPDIQARVKTLREASFARLDASADDVLRMWWETATADPNELTQHRTGACRYCWGQGHAYHWKTPREYDEVKDDEAEAEAGNAAKQTVTAAAKRTVTDEGGYGFKRNAAPNADCPECAGEGATYIVFADTTKLSPQARLLFNGVKQTKSGTEIIVADRQKALEHVARRLGLMKETVQHDIGTGLGQLLSAIKSTGSAAPLSAPDAHLHPDDDP